MPSPWQVSWVGGGCAGGAIAAYLATGVVSQSGLPEGLLPLAVQSLLVIALCGLFVALAIRLGLSCAGSQPLSWRATLIIPTVFIPILALLGTIPVKTHAVVIDMPPSGSSVAGLDVLMFGLYLGVLLIPGTVAFIVAKISRHGASAA